METPFTDFSEARRASMWLCGDDGKVVTDNKREFWALDRDGRRRGKECTLSSPPTVPMKAFVKTSDVRRSHARVVVGKDDD